MEKSHIFTLYLKERHLRAFLVFRRQMFVDCSIGQLMINCWFGLVVWIPGIPYARDCYLRTPFESQTNNYPLAEMLPNSKNMFQYVPILYIYGNYMCCQRTIGRSWILGTSDFFVQLGGWRELGNVGKL